MLFKKIVLKLFVQKEWQLWVLFYLWPDVRNAGKNQVLVFFNAGKSEQPNNNIPDGGGVIFHGGNFLGLLLRSGQASGRQIWTALLPFVSGAGENCFTVGSIRLEWNTRKDEELCLVNVYSI